MYLINILSNTSISHYGHCVFNCVGKIFGDNEHGRPEKVEKELDQLSNTTRSFFYKSH